LLRHKSGIAEVVGNEFHFFAPLLLSPPLPHPSKSMIHSKCGTTMCLYYYKYNPRKCAIQNKR
jgi:hypothetical protein